MNLKQIFERVVIGLIIAGGGYVLSGFFSADYYYLVGLVVGAAGGIYLKTKK